MATGRRAFTAESTAGLIAAIMSAEAVPLALQDDRGRQLEWVLHRCLKKKPDARWQSMSDVEAVLRWLASTSALRSERPADGVRSRSVRAIAVTAAGVVALGFIGLFATATRNRAAEPTSLIAFTVPPPEGGEFKLTEGSVTSPQLAVSPDGRSLAFVASASEAGSQIWVRPLDSATARPIAGTASGQFPFWSPNNRSLCFFADRQLKRIDLDGGPARVIASASSGRGGTWGPGNLILFAPDTTNTIWRVNPDGTGLARQTTFTVDRGDTSHRWPEFLPDGRHFVFFARSSLAAKEGVYLSAIDSSEATLLVESSFGAVSTSGGQLLLYAVEGTLMARSIDVSNARLSGEPIPVAEGVGGSSSFYGAFSASNTGVIAYASSASQAEVDWFDRSGTKRAVAAGRGRYVDFQLSPDARYIALADVEPHTDRPDIEILDLLRGNKLRLTFSRSTDASPVWSPDGSTVVFRSNRDRSARSVSARVGRNRERPSIPSYRPARSIRPTGRLTGPISFITRTASQGGISGWRRSLLGASRGRSCKRNSMKHKGRCHPTATGWRTRRSRPATDLKCSCRRSAAKRISGKSPSPEGPIPIGELTDPNCSTFSLMAR